MCNNTMQFGSFNINKMRYINCHVNDDKGSTERGMNIVRKKYCILKQIHLFIPKLHYKEKIIWQEGKEYLIKGFKK